MAAEIPLSSFFPCLFGSIMYKLCGLNSAPGKLWNFLVILVAESMASASFGMSIGSLVPSVDAGVAISPAAIVVFIVFGGLYIVNTPSYLAWIPEISLIRWAYEGLCVNEFSGLVFEQKGPLKLGPSKGEEVLERMSMTHSIPHTLKAQLGFTLFNYAFTCLMLMLQNPRGQSVVKDLITTASSGDSLHEDDVHDDSIVATAVNEEVIEKPRGSSSTFDQVKTPPTVIGHFGAL